MESRSRKSEYSNKSSKYSYERRYTAISEWFLASRSRMYLLKFIYRYIPYFVAVSYMILIFFCLAEKQNIVSIKVVLVPFISFVFVSVMRKLFNYDRPYVKYRITPLIPKNKQGESFPSRHTLSVSIIAMAWCYVDIRIGLLLWVLTILIAASRVISGVHFLRDVLAAIVISILFGFFGFFII